MSNGSYIRNALYSSAEQTCDSAVRELGPWNSTYSVSLICKRRNIAPGTRYSQERRKLGREIKISLRQDRENWWLRKAEEMESAAASGNSAKLFQLIPQTGFKGIKVSEVTEEKDRSLISNQESRLERWAEHFNRTF